MIKVLANFVSLMIFYGGYIIFCLAMMAFIMGNFEVFSWPMEARFAFVTITTSFGLIYGIVVEENEARRALVEALEGWE